MINKEKAIDFVTDYINNDMQRKDRWSEINWLLNKVYKPDDTSQIVEDWCLDDEEQWGNDYLKKIYEEKEDDK
tara:strand:- start:439 stop:657 length:219 start_codon:yes stop_codon:yes gene_type:complete